MSLTQPADLSQSLHSSGSLNSDLTNLVKPRRLARPSGVREKPPVPNSAEPQVTTTTPHLCMFFSAAQHCPASPVGWPSSRCYEPETKTTRPPAKLPTALNHSSGKLQESNATCTLVLTCAKENIIFQHVDASLLFLQVTQITFPRQTSPNNQILHSSSPWNLFRLRTTKPAQL